jgi:hypothetical protein
VAASKCRAGESVDVPGTFVVNFGDSLERGTSAQQNTPAGLD